MLFWFAAEFEFTTAVCAGWIVLVTTDPPIVMTVTFAATVFVTGPDPCFEESLGELPHASDCHALALILSSSVH